MGVAIAGTRCGKMEDATKLNQREQRVLRFCLLLHESETLIHKVLDRERFLQMLWTWVHVKHGKTHFCKHFVH